MSTDNDDPKKPTDVSKDEKSEKSLSGLSHKENSDTEASVERPAAEEKTPKKKPTAHLPKSSPSLSIAALHDKVLDFDTEEIEDDKEDPFQGRCAFVSFPEGETSVHLDIRDTNQFGKNFARQVTRSLNRHAAP